MLAGASEHRDLIEVDGARGSQPPWPCVLYFHRVVAASTHYTEISATELRYALSLIDDAASFTDGSSVAAGGRHFAPNTSEREFLITFDDGHLDAVVKGMPALDCFGVRALFFITTEWIGQPGHVDWGCLRELVAAGHGIGSHTLSHPPLPSLAAAAVRQQIADSVAALEQELQIPVNTFAYPYGRVPPMECFDESWASKFLGFSTARVAPADWQQRPLAIRRTFLPQQNVRVWGERVRGWAAA